jgi:hypothetical protein
MNFKFFSSYRAACEWAASMEVKGYQTAVLISGEVRYWK